MSRPYTGSHRLGGPDAVRSLATSIAAGIERGWSDLFAAPLHDFPIRDEILWEYLTFAPGADVLEIGPGSGFTAFRLAPRVRQLTLLDAASRAIDDLRRTLRSIPNIEFVYADVAASDLAEQMGKHAFDVVFGLDVFEYVTDPAGCLRNLANVLRADGELFLTFPNVPPPVGDGVTWFTDLTRLEAMIAEAGFSTWEIFAVRPGRFAAAVYTALHEWPLRAYRRLRSGNGDARPQIYEATWAFQHRERLLRFRVVLHLFWILLGWAMRLGGRCMVAEPVGDRPLGRQFVVRAWK
jgi:SAM-dependent methyltransferase